MYKIKADEKLFDDIKEILRQMELFLPTIIQNDMEITQDEYIDFFDNYEKYINKLDDWMIEVKHQIKKEAK